MYKIYFNRRSTSIQIVILVMLGAALACGGGNGAQESAPPDVSSNTEQEYEEVEIDPPSIAPSTEGDTELIEKWRIPISSGVLVSVVCDSLLETATQRDAGEIDGIEALGEVLGAGLLLDALDEGLLEWEPILEQNAMKVEFLSYVESLKAVIGPWINQEIDSADVLNELPDTCEAARFTTEGVLEAATEDGLREDDLENLADELAQGLEDALAESGENEETQPDDDVIVETGFGRNNPYPPSELVQAPNWDIQILEFVRGGDAWASIQAANSFNDPPPEGMEYLLIKLFARSTYSDDDEHNISEWDFNLTGDNLIRYDPASAVDPDPQLDFTVYTDGEGEGWISFLIGEGEGNLILIFDELANWDDDRFRYSAIEEGSKIEIPADLRDIQPTDLGTKRMEPAPFGETVITEDWEVSALEIVRGEDAWVMVEDANMFNDPPEEGMEYIAVKFQVRYIGTRDRYETIDSSFFNSTGDNGVVYDIPLVVDPEPALDSSLFPGGEYVGWIVLQAAEGETGVKAIFEPWLDFSDENKRFLSVEK